MEDQDIKLLDDYFNGLLAPEAETAVKQRVETDAAFGDEFRLRVQMNNWIKQVPAREAFRQQTATLGDAFFQDTGSGTGQPMQVVWRRRLMAAAAILLLAFGAWWLLRPEEPLYRQFASNAPLHLTERSNTPQQAVAAESAFNRKDYPAALVLLQQVVAQQPDNATARLYTGITLLELKRPAEARNTLEPLARGASVLQSDARWNIALSYLLDNDLGNCRAALKQIPDGDRYKTQADALILKLK
jgi:hypothetical protein